jgi:hypothetical protein
MEESEMRRASRIVRTIAWSPLLSFLVGTVLAETADFPSQSQLNQREAALTRMKGGELTAEQAARLVPELASDPSALDKRIQRIGYLRAHDSLGSRDELRAHALWLIENRPEWCFQEMCSISEFGPDYLKGRRLWLAHLDRQPATATLVGHAASYFMEFELERAIELLRRGRQLEPDDDTWAKRLSFTESLQQRHEAAPADHYEKLLADYERVPDDTMLAALARAALAAGELEPAELYARAALEASSRLDGWYRGLAVYYGHSTLGLLALEHDDVRSAVDHLVAAADTPGAPRLARYPGMALADGLVSRGETEAVVEFLEKCRAFSGAQGPPLDEWIETLRQGDAPFFGPYLRY